MKNMKPTKLEVKTLEIENLENAGCNNGNYPHYTSCTLGGHIISGITCNCGRGCHGMDQVEIDHETGKKYIYIREE